MNIRSIFYLSCMLTFLVGLLIGIMFGRSFNKDKPKEEPVKETVEIPTFGKIPQRQWEIPIEDNLKFKVVETEIQDQAVFIIWKNGCPTEFKVITKKKY